MTYLVNTNRIGREIDNMFKHMLLQKSHGCSDCSDFIPRVNIKEDDDAVAIMFELPGMEKGDIKVTVENHVLTVTGERKFSSEDEKDGFVRTEILNGSFSRSFTLPKTVDTESVSADYKQGILTVSLARKEEAKPKQIEVQVN